MIWERKHTNTHQALMPNHQLARKPSVPTCGGAAGAGERVEDELEGRWPEMKGEGGGIGTPTLLHICPRPTPFLQTHRPPLQTTCNAERFQHQNIHNEAPSQGSPGRAAFG